MSRRVAREFPRGYLAFMARKPSRPRDFNELATLVGDIATRQREEPEVTLSDAKASKRGKARAAALSPKRRKAIAKKAAAARWGKKV